MPGSVSPNGPADAGIVKAYNLMLVWRCIQRHGPIGRVDIAQRTGLSKGALTALAAELIRLGLVREAGAAAPTGRGRPIELLAMDGASMTVAAVQLRLEDLVIAACDLSGHERYRLVVRHGRPMANPEALARQMAMGLDRCHDALRAEGRTLLQASAVVAAPLWGDPPIVPQAVDFGWGEVDLLELIGRHLERTVPLRLENDAAAAIRAERAALPLSPHTMLFLKSHTGIGGAAIGNDEVLEGAHRMAFEPGHVVVDSGGRRCGCGQRGCLVTVAGPEAVLANAGLAAVATALGSRAALGELVARWRAGEDRAVAAVADAVTWIGRAITGLRMLYDPELIVLGGYWSGLIEPVKEELARQWGDMGGLFATRWRTDLIRPALVGDDAAVLGALAADADASVRRLLGA